MGMSLGLGVERMLSLAIPRENTDKPLPSTWATSECTWTIPQSTALAADQRALFVFAKSIQTCGPRGQPMEIVTSPRPFHGASCFGTSLARSTL